MAFFGNMIAKRRIGYLTETYTEQVVATIKDICKKREKRGKLYLELGRDYADPRVCTIKLRCTNLEKSRLQQAFVEKKQVCNILN